MWQWPARSLQVCLSVCLWQHFSKLLMLTLQCMTQLHCGACCVLKHQTLSSSDDWYVTGLKTQLNYCNRQTDVATEWVSISTDAERLMTETTSVQLQQPSVTVWTAHDGLSHAVLHWTVLSRSIASLHGYADSFVHVVMQEALVVTSSPYWHWTLPRWSPSVVSSKLDYSNTLLHQPQQPASGTEHTGQGDVSCQLHRQLHRLPFHQRITYNIAVITYNHRHSCLTLSADSRLPTRTDAMIHW